MASTSLLLLIWRTYKILLLCSYPLPYQLRFALETSAGKAPMKGKATFIDRCLEPGCIQLTRFDDLADDDEYKLSKNVNDGRPSIVSEIFENGTHKRRESTDFEDAITNAGYGKLNYFVLLVSLPVACSAVMVTIGTSFVIPEIGCDFHINNFEKGILQVSSFIGMIGTAFFWGSLSDTFGRKKLMVYGFILDSLVGIGASLAPSFGIMVFMKILTGVLNCGPSSIFATYLSEIFPKDKRDLAVMTCGSFSGIGAVLQPALALLIMWHFPLDPPLTLFAGYQLTSWRLFLIACTLPSILSAIGCMFVPESPKFLLEKGRKDEALRVLQTVYSINTGQPADMYSVQKLREMRSPSIIASSKLLTTFSERFKSGIFLSLSIFRKPYIGRAMYYFIIQFGVMAGSNGVRMWLPQVFAIAENSNSNSTHAGAGICEILSLTSDSSSSFECGAASPVTYMNMMIINSGLLISYPLFILFVKRFGTKIPIVLVTLLPGFFLLAIPLVPSSYVVYVAGMFSSLTGVAFFALLTSVVGTFPTKLRATSVSMTQTVGRIGVLCANLFVSLLIIDNCSTVLYSIAGLLIVVGIVAVVMPTTPIDLGRKRTLPPPRN